MLFHSFDKLTFGKYRGISVGMIYLLDPSYIEWMLETGNYGIGDINFLKSLKVIDCYGEQGFVAHFAEIDREEFENNYIKYGTFEDFKFSGYKDFYFSKDSLDENQTILRKYTNEIKEGSIVPEAEREIFIFYPISQLKSNKTEFIPTGFSNSSTGKTIISFDADNTRMYINFLPHRPTVKISSFYFNEWQISVEEVNKRIEEKKPFLGKIINGFLELES